MTHDRTAAWERMPDDLRRSTTWVLWLLTWIGLLAGLRDPAFYRVVVASTTAHLILVLALNRFRFSASPVQARISYLLWVTVGTYVPHMTVLLYIATLGLIGNLFFDYCALARLMYLLPWNREEKLSFDLVARVFPTPPAKGRFRPLPRG
ncbi:MAG: hypothetical protein L0191_19905 [Acidobacteria bacterium]|nr:hypothetical protein [Acidobacteriota bacterium]